ncbi:Membrane-Spanning 4-Domains Subfamily A Member 14 [Manis pentadactyla]|nr:Membrane-Spanning 4-Domains Subfamily A Member 14 [Manis pentadactyla]
MTMSEGTTVRGRGSLDHFDSSKPVFSPTHGHHLHRLPQGIQKSTAPLAQDTATEKLLCMSKVAQDLPGVTCLDYELPGHKDPPLDTSMFLALSTQLNKCLEFENTPEDSPEPEARGVVPGRSETPGQLPAAAEDGLLSTTPGNGTRRPSCPGEKRCGCLVGRGRRLGAAAKETRVEDFALPEGAPRASSPLCTQDSDVQAHVEEKEEPSEELESLEDSDVDEDVLPVEEMVYMEAYVEEKPYVEEEEAYVEEDMHVEEMVYLEA